MGVASETVEGKQEANAPSSHTAEQLSADAVRLLAEVDEAFATNRWVACALRSPVNPRRG
jgi:hypothetical protein